MLKALEIKARISSTWAWTSQGEAAFKHTSSLYVSTTVYIQTSLHREKWEGNIPGDVMR